MALPYPFCSACCGLASILCTLVAVWRCPYPVCSAGCVTAVRSCFYLMYSGCCVALPLSYLQRLLCGLDSILGTVVAVWHCPYPVCSSGCDSCVVLLLSYELRLLCGVAPILFAALAVWHCPYPICSACCVVLPLSYLQRLLCGIAPILFAALAVWHFLILFAALAVCSCFYLICSAYPICSACCVVLLVSFILFVQGLPCGIAPILFAALAE